MSPMSEEQTTEQRSSITVTCNAKGQRQWQVKCYSPTPHPQDVEAARDLAVKIDHDLQATYGLPG